MNTRWCHSLKEQVLVIVLKNFPLSDFNFGLIRASFLDSFPNFYCFIFQSPVLPFLAFSYSTSFRLFLVLTVRTSYMYRLSKLKIYRTTDGWQVSQIKLRSQNGVQYHFSCNQSEIIQYQILNWMHIHPSVSYLLQTLCWSQKWSYRLHWKCLYGDWYYKWVKSVKGFAYTAT